VRTYNGDESSVCSRTVRGGRPGVRSRTAAIAAAVLVAMGLLFLRTPGLVLAKPHPHVDKPAYVVVASAPDEMDDTKHEAVTGGDTTKVFQWKVPTPPAPVAKVDEYKKKHTKKVSCLAVSRGGTGPNPNKLFRASYDGHVLVSTLGDFTNGGFITFFDTFTPPPPMGPAMEVWSVAASPDGLLAVSGTNYGEITVWDADTGDLRGNVPPETSFYPVGGLAFRKVPQGQNPQILAARDGGEVVRYELVPAANGKIALTDMNKTFSHGNELAVNSVAVTSNGDIAVSAGFDMTVRIWNVETLAVIKDITDHKNIVWRVAISPNNDRVASASEDGTVRLYTINGEPLIDPATNKPAVIQEPKMGGIMGVAFVTNDKVVYTAEDQAGADVKVWMINGFHP